MNIQHEGYKKGYKSIDIPSVRRRYRHRNDISTTNLFKKPPTISVVLPKLPTQAACPPLPTNKQTRKRHLLPPRRREELKSNQKQLQDADIEKWLESTGRFPEKQWRIREKRALKSWFDRLDRDHSGEIDVQELADPLISTGLAKSISEVKSLIKSIDEDNSNGIGFEEFLSVMKSKKNLKSNQEKDKSRSKRIGEVKKWTNVVKKVNRNKLDQTSHHSQPQTRKKLLNPIVQLTEQEHDKILDTSSSLCWERRKLLLDATIGEAERRQEAFEKVHRWRREIKQMNGVAKVKKLRDISKVVQKMEVDQAEKENLVSAMKGVLSRAIETNSNNIEIMSRIKSEEEKESLRKRNVMMLIPDSRLINHTGGRHALAYPKTRYLKYNG